MKKIIYVFITVLGVSLYSNIPEDVEEAIQKIDYRFIDFNYKIVDKQVMNGHDLTRISNFRPGNEILFDLQSKNGKVPTARDKMKYNRDKINIFGKDRFVDDTNFTFLSLAKADEYILIENKNGISVYEFINTNSVIPENDSPLKGTIYIDNETRNVKEIHLKNIEPMDVFIGISINYFELEFEFEASDSNFSLIKGINCVIYGHVLFVEIDYVSSFSMSNYSYIN